MLRAGPVRTAWLDTIQPIARENIAAGSIVTTDEHGGYNDLHYLGVEHGRVTRSKGEYVRGIPYHTNTIEGHWGYF